MLSNELLSIGASQLAPRLAKQLRAAGFTRLTAVGMYRTPAVHYARSMYNELHAISDVTMSPVGPVFLEAFDNVALDGMLQYRRLLLNATHHFKSAGFDVQLVDLAGAAAEGLDEVDVVACQIMRLPCTRNGTWAAGTKTAVTNTRQKEPDPRPQIAAAYYEWERNATRGVAGNVTCRPPRMPSAFFSMMTRVLLPMLGKPAESSDYVCTDYAEQEKLALAADTSFLNSVCVLHRSATPRITPTKDVTVCRLSPQLSLDVRVRTVFARFCAARHLHQ